MFNKNAQNYESAHTQCEIPVLLQVNDSLTKVATFLQIRGKKKRTDSQIKQLSHEKQCTMLLVNEAAGVIGGLLRSLGLDEWAAFG